MRNFLTLLIVASIGLTGCKAPTIDENLTKTSLEKQNDSSESFTPALSHAELLALAKDEPVDLTALPLGDAAYRTDQAEKGKIYLCNAHQENPGSAVEGPWMGSSSWDLTRKISIQGDVTWPAATFKSWSEGIRRILEGNGLPTTHSTGVFPVQKNDPAAQYDPNPNTIQKQSIKENLPIHPVYSETPYCMGGEVGVMMTGVRLFNGFDAGLRDAAAHELQDSCQGHPEKNGTYHYHGISACWTDQSVQTVLGYALDGFPITGPEVEKGLRLSTQDLDLCHGIISDIWIDGELRSSYHYVMTDDFPYSVSCFRGEPVRTGPSDEPAFDMKTNPPPTDQTPAPPAPPAPPLQERRGQR